VKPAKSTVRRAGSQSGWSLGLTICAAGVFDVLREGEATFATDFILLTKSTWISAGGIKKNGKADPTGK
jgi:hypothetical protein